MIYFLTKTREIIVIFGNEINKENWPKINIEKKV